MARNRRKNGWAYTKKYPHLNHPAYYEKTDIDAINYITITHNDEVEIDGKIIKTIELQGNVSKIEREEDKNLENKRKSYVVPKVYTGKRSALGKEINKFNFIEEDKQTIKKLFNILPKEKVPNKKAPKKST